MTNRKHYPNNLKVKKLPQRGDFRFLCRNSVTCMAWQDRKPIHFISNYHNPADVVTANRRNKDGSVSEIQMLQLIQDYNMFIGGCDKNDQLTRLHKTRKHYRWHRRRFIKFFMWACYNAYVLSNAFNNTQYKHVLHKIHPGYLFITYW